MTNSLEQALATTIQESKEGIGKSVDWVIKQMPDICEQYLRFEMIKATMCTVTFCILICILLYAVYKGIKYGLENLPEYDRSILCLWSIALIPFTIFICCAVDNFLIVTKIYIAPKVYLVEFASTLLKH